MRNGTLGGAALMALGLGASDPALAGDFAEYCSSAGGDFELEFQQNGATLYGVENGARAAARPAEILHETILFSQQSECVDDRSPDVKYTYSTLVTAVTVRIQDGGWRRRISVICETHSSGVPAAATCSDDRVTFQSGLHAP